MLVAGEILHTFCDQFELYLVAIEARKTICYESNV